MTELSEKIAERVLEMINAQPRTPRRVELALEIQRLLDEYAAKDCEPGQPFTVEPNLIGGAAVVGCDHKGEVFMSGWNINCHGQPMIPRRAFEAALDWLEDKVQEYDN